MPRGALASSTRCALACLSPAPRALISPLGALALFLSTERAVSGARGVWGVFCSANASGPSGPSAANRSALLVARWKASAVCSFLSRADCGRELDLVYI